METVAKVLESEPLQKEAWQWFGMGLGLAFLITIALIVLFFCYSAFFAEEGEGIDLGFLGLIFLLVIIFYLVGFSFLVAASAKGLDVKALVAAVDVFVLLGGKLLAPEFLRYLADEPIGAAGTGKASQAQAKLGRKTAAPSPG